jgi:hypothetical protein
MTDITELEQIHALQASARLENAPASQSARRRDASAKPPELQPDLVGFNPQDRIESVARQVSFVAFFCVGLADCFIDTSPYVLCGRL